ncbi:undecaprenyl-phosphate galactose phosphotransferase WbaP [Limobrevibacterium gyesilva]|uniref:Undecaprenyl-phosphate galactose phosphotransferase WbaP n=1 Tax=Limobrevibacterium gyesilva TaxID=2991712 RepID=A0AA42CEM4_9PROT|nr:undecaprenyl-phosphate galactose phosphotransferase WbaP [Limobrevibacterium gyesilva]MCW3475474.1 undecaprenyl-phosphate galactose phosphotransferase WbaP [Limobrevibacterium gyesilva]
MPNEFHRLGGAEAVTGQGVGESVADFGPRLRRLRPSRFVQPTAWSYFVLASDLVALCVAFVLAFVLAGVVNAVVLDRRWQVGAEDIARHIRMFGVLALVMIGYLHRKGHYIRRIAFWTAVQDVTKVSLFGMLIDGFVQFALQQAMSRSWFLCLWLLAPVAVVGMRVVTRNALDLAGLWQRRVLIAGGTEAARVAQAALLSDATMGYEIAGRVRLEAVTAGVPGASFAALLRHYGASLLLLAPGDDPFQLRRPVVAQLVHEHVDFAIIPSMDGLPEAGYDPQPFLRHDVLLLTYRNNADLPFARGAKVAFDLAAAVTLLLLLAPVLLAIAALIRRDGGPVLFAQTRVGHGGRRFNCLKFRTMVVNADQVLRDALAGDPRAAVEWANNQKLRRDPRVTPIGRLLRQTSLDELPQLFNVLRLEMSLVGPRPIVEHELPRYGDELAYYCSVRPGLTGLWQVSGRNDTSYGRKVQLDCWYVRNWTLWQDLVILMKTVPVVLFRKGAF